MALPSSGAISLSQVSVELGRAANASVSLGETASRNLAGVASGAISLANLYGKSAVTKFTNSVNRVAASVFALMGSPTEAGNFEFTNTAVISAGTEAYALTTGVFPAGSTLTIINNGTIQGKGGVGGTPGAAGAAGGTALLLEYACEVDNTSGYIFGGGGGGGGATCVSGAFSIYSYASGGGGAGATAGAGGSTTKTGTAGTTTSGGAGGDASGTVGGKTYRAKGGAGGAPGAAGAQGSYVAPGTGWTTSSTAGGAAGKAINPNNKALTITGGNNTTQIKGAVA